MIDAKFWREEVLNLIENISDRKYQLQSWFGKEKCVSSPEEFLCQLYDDLVYEDFLNSKEIDLTVEQKNLGEELREKLDKFSDSFEDFIDPKVALDNELWIDVRVAAKKFIDVMSHRPRTLPGL